MQHTHHPMHAAAQRTLMLESPLAAQAALPGAAVPWHQDGRRCHDSWYRQTVLHQSCTAGGRYWCNVKPRAWPHLSVLSSTRPKSLAAASAHSCS